MSENNQQSKSISFNPYISPKISDMLVNKFHSNLPININNHSIDSINSTDLIDSHTHNVIISFFT